MGKVSNHPLPFFPCIHEHHPHRIVLPLSLVPVKYSVPISKYQSYHLAGHLNDSNPQQGEMEVPCHHCPMSCLTIPSIYDRSVCVSVCLETTLSILVQNKHTRHSKTLKISLKSTWCQICCQMRWLNMISHRESFAVLPVTHGIPSVCTYTLEVILGISIIPWAFWVTAFISFYTDWRISHSTLLWWFMFC